MSQTSTAGKAIEEKVQELGNQLCSDIERIHQLIERAKRTNDEIKTLSAAYRSLEGEDISKELLPYVDPYFFSVGLSFLGKAKSGENATIGDAMEDILENVGKPLDLKEMIARLRGRGVRLSLKNPRIVIANTIKQDKNVRFKRLSDGRVTLSKKQQMTAKK